MVEGWPRINFCRSTDSGRNFWEVSAEGGAERALTELEGKRGIANRWALSTDGHYLYFVWQEEFGDIWVMDVTQD